MRSEVGTRGTAHLTCSPLSVELEKSLVVLGGKFDLRKRETSDGVLVALILV